MDGHPPDQPPKQRQLLEEYGGFNELEAALQGPDGPGLLPQIINRAQQQGCLAQLLHRQGGSLLHQAALLGQGKVVQQLLEAGVNPGRGPGDWPVPPLLAAATRGHGSIVEQLLAAGATPNPVMLEVDGGPAPLHGACIPGNLQSVCALLAAGAELEWSILGMTPLAVAASGDDTAVTQLLLEAGANPNVWVDVRHKPLLMLCLQGEAPQSEIVRLLVAAGADVNARDDQGSTPLLFAAKYGLHAQAGLLVAAGADWKASGPGGILLLREAAIRGHPRVVEVLLAAGAEADASTEDGYTPLLAACWEGDPEVVKLLIAEGADVTAATHHNLPSPLMMAAARGHTAVVKQLLAAGANTASQLQVALMGAAFSGRANTVQLLADTASQTSLEGEARAAAADRRWKSLGLLTVEVQRLYPASLPQVLSGLDANGKAAVWQQAVQARVREGAAAASDKQGLVLLQQEVQGLLVDLAGHPAVGDGAAREACRGRRRGRKRPAAPTRASSRLAAKQAKG